MNLLNLFDIVDAVAAQKQSEQPTDNVVDVPATVQASQANGQPATIVVPVAAASEVEVLEDDHEDSLNIGDEVIIAGNVQYQGKTGRVVDFGRNKHFVIVDLYNFGKHSFHSSNVEHNDYADSEEEDADWRERDHGLFGDDERDEVDENNNTIFTATKDLEQEKLPPGMGRGHDFGPQIDQWKAEVKQKYPRLGNIEFADIRRAIPKDGSKVETALVKHPKTGEYFKLGSIYYNGFKPGVVDVKIYDAPQPLDPKWDRFRSNVSEASSDWEDEADQAERFYQMVVKKLSAIDSPGERESVAGQLSKIEQKYFGARSTSTLSNGVVVTPIVNSVLIALRAGRVPAANSNNNNPNGVIAVGQRPQTGIAGREKPMFDRASREAKKFLANARDEILDADEGYELVKVVDALSRNQINNFRDVDWQEINTEFGPMIATADVLVLVNKLGKNPSTDNVEVNDQERDEVNEDNGGYYYEILARKVFDERPNFSTSGRADELVDYAYRFAVQDLGKDRARYEFNYDEDFLSDFVSAYGELQRGEQGVTEAKGLNKRVRVVKTGETGTIRQVKHGAFKGAPKSYFVDLDNGKQADNLPASALRLIKDGVAEGFLGDREYNRVMPFVKRIASEVSDYDRDEFGEELWSLLDQKYGPKFAQSVLDDIDFYWDTYTELTDQQGVAEGEYDDPRWEQPEPDTSRKVDWDIEAERNRPEESEPAKTVTVRDNDGNVVLQFPSTGGFHGDVRYAASKGIDTDSGEYHMSWKRDANEGNNWLDTPVSEEFDRIKKLAGLK